MGKDVTTVQDANENGSQPHKISHLAVPHAEKTADTYTLRLHCIIAVLHCAV